MISKELCMYAPIKTGCINIVYRLFFTVCKAEINHIPYSLVLP
jgi:hypothetical protein